MKNMTTLTKKEIENIANGYLTQCFNNGTYNNFLAPEMINYWEAMQYIVWVTKEVEIEIEILEMEQDGSPTNSRLLKIQKLKNNLYNGQKIN